MSDPASLQVLADRFRATGALGRSQLIQKLFDFLLECSATGRAPKETEVAIEVFGKDAGFDVAQDAMVRVYVHKLRRKLEEYYSAAGHKDPFHLTIPKGAYRIVITDREALAAAADQANAALAELSDAAGPEGADSVAVRPLAGTRHWIWPALAASLLVNLLLGTRYWSGQPRAPADPVLSSAVWSRMLTSERPLLVVLGDYYIFAETDKNMEVQRLVREFSINSAGELDQYLKLHPELGDRYQDMQLNYLPTSAAFALKDLMPLLAGAAARTRVVLASDITPAMLKSSDVIYIGYLSGMGMLGDLAFSGSRFDVGESFDVLIDRASGKRFISQAAMPVPGEQTYHDFGYFATFAGPSGNQIMIIAGTRDVAVMQTAESVTRGDSLQQLSARSGNIRSFDALYDVFAMNGTDLNGTLLLTGKIDTARIWADEPRGAAHGPRAMTEPTAAPRPRKPRYAATVQRIEKLTPRMLRIVFGGSELAGFNWNGPAAHIKLILGSVGSDADARPLSRTYTPRHFDAARGELSVDFVLHGEGPASTWAAQARIGQPMLIAGPGRCYAVDEQAQWLLVAGDESAIPAVATILEVVPERVRTQVLLEVNDAADEFAIAPRRAHVNLRWLHRAQPIVGHGGDARAGVELAAAIAAFELPAGTGRIYVACEADAMRGIRRQLLTERGVARDWLTTRGYWKQGATDYPDRDYGEDAG